jgi:hypothetical protein
MSTALTVSDVLGGHVNVEPECTKPKRAQALADAPSPDKIDAPLRKWLRYRDQLSIRHAQFSLSQVLDRPLTGRRFFEDVICDNLGIGRPGHVQRIFDRRVTRRTPRRLRTRVITEGLTPSLHVACKHAQIKQCHKEGRGLRTETTNNNTRHFGIGTGHLAAGTDKKG